jgi:hypothetical protein
MIAPACGVAWGGKFSLVEVCTTQGIEIKVVENTSAPSNPSSPHQQANEDCQFCFQNTHLMAGVMDAQIINHPKYSLTTKILSTRDILYRQILSQYHTARGPPSHT